MELMKYRKNDSDFFHFFFTLERNENSNENTELFVHALSYTCSDLNFHRSVEYGWYIYKYYSEHLGTRAHSYINSIKNCFCFVAHIV